MRRRLVFAATLIVVGVAGARFSGGTSPCRTYAPIELTGTLVEVRRDDTVVPSDDPILSVLPRVLCMAPLHGTPVAGSVDVRDCYDSRSQAVFHMEAP